MISLIKQKRTIIFNKHEGMSLTEAFVLLVIVALSVAAMLQTSFVTSQMQMTGRKYVESHKSMVTFYQTLESIDPAEIKLNMSGVLNSVQNINPIESYASISNVSADLNDSAIIVSITLTDSDRSHKAIEGYFNTFSNKTVSDDRDKNYD